MQETTPAPGPGALDETDLALVHALQLAPRAAWVDLATVLGTTAPTLARRWRRLTATGTAWMTCHPGLPKGAAPPVGSMALVEVTVAPGRVPGVVAELSRHTNAVNIQLLTGSRDLFVTVVASDAERLSRYLHVRLPAVPGITGIRVQVPLRIHKDAGAWRLRALDRDQRRRLAELTRTPGTAPAPFDLDAEDRAILSHLGPDGRLSTAELARRLGLSGATVARRLSRLTASGRARFRCEIARPLTGRPVTMTWWLRVPAAELHATATELVALGDVRLCMAVTGTANLVVVMWLRHPSDATASEADWARRFPRVEVLDSAMTLQAVKCVGRLVDAGGRGTGYVPIHGFEDVRDAPAPPAFPSA
ncbi:Lrp/AsnC family transcriptional regulator [Streptomyces sp. FH025]|uniref:Lrp/AsnC family transcriptional regulator n=1 Tax=Streptomyces sp. FH025 TaxID=2815937 RepID=UPI001A9F0335|nr:Lrp/AsnC family transcriptional regulator [Streptomyces sp. FH025]MBO1415969.1 Lrp/AsnC family transcriptional regulator [Streptomyces sp. FH025]